MFNNTQSGEYDGGLPPEETGGSSSGGTSGASPGVASLVETLNAVKEFNMNTTIFATAAGQLTSALNRLATTQSVITRHTSDIASLKFDVTGLKAKVNSLDRRIDGIGAYNPVFDADGRNRIDDISNTFAKIVPRGKGLFR
jgi:hypothetical protein